MDSGKQKDLEAFDQMNNQTRKTPEVLDSVARSESLHFDWTMVVCAATAVNLETDRLSTWNCQPGNRSILLKTAFFTFQ